MGRDDHLRAPRFNQGANLIHQQVERSGIEPVFDFFDDDQGKWIRMAEQGKEGQNSQGAGGEEPTSRIGAKKKIRLRMKWVTEKQFDNHLL